MCEYLAVVVYSLVWLSLRMYGGLVGNMDGELGEERRDAVDI